MRNPPVSQPCTCARTYVKPKPPIYENMVQLGRVATSQISEPNITVRKESWPLPAKVYFVVIHENLRTGDTVFRNLDVQSDVLIAQFGGGSGLTMTKREKPKNRKKSKT